MKILPCLLCVVVCLSLSSFTCNASKTEPPICCVRDEWEGRMYLDYGTVFIDANTAFSYINGTVRIAYSILQKKIYLGIKGIEQSPLIPKPTAMDAVMLYDFTKGILFNVVNNDCQKSDLDQNMTHQCIPADAKLLSQGNMGDDALATISTYRFISTTDLPLQITATVHQSDSKTCDPVHVTYFTPSVNPDSGSLYSLDVLDIRPLNSTDIFKVPKQCL